MLQHSKETTSVRGIRGSRSLRKVYNSPALQRAVVTKYDTGTNYSSTASNIIRKQTAIAAHGMMVCPPLAGVRVSFFFRSTRLPHRLGASDPLLHTCSRCHPLPSYFPFSPPPKTQYFTNRSCSSDLENKKPIRVNAICLFPHRQRSVSLLLHNRIQASCRCCFTAAVLYFAL